ncbi:hypothetical protein FOE78_01305 [Microlunatus elymi]|uniref:Uncharacterized protein n=1 Tax=Microlunatus elymi TaxID=2596828 RepID=A0A516PU54_9ACTN|nr:hypothetical protein [Microlunatus elymi]QDP94734.1 hypothetical protein FOE78_01305 [Microlunatus elymi]
MFDAIVLVVTGVLAFGGAMVGAWISARAGHRGWQREETMESLRWAVGLAVAPQARTQQIGVAALVALVNANMVQAEQRSYVRRILNAVVEVEVDDAHRTIEQPLNQTPMRTDEPPVTTPPSRAAITAARALVGWADRGEGTVTDRIRGIARYPLPQDEDDTARP